MLIWNVLVNCFYGSTSGSVASSPPPALANTTSRPRPLALMALATLSKVPSRFDTSPRMPVAPAPIDATASSRVFWFRPVMKTCAPSAANRCAVARPMPELPPVTSAVLPESLPMAILPPLSEVRWDHHRLLHQLNMRDITRYSMTLGVITKQLVG